MDNPIQSSEFLHFSLPKDVASLLATIVDSSTIELAKLPSILAFVQEIKDSVKPIFPVQPSTSGLISSYENQDDEQPIVKPLPAFNWLSRIRRFPDHENQYISWGMDSNGIPTGFVALLFQRPEDVTAILENGSTYSLIRHESEIVLIVRAQIKDAEDYKAAYNHIRKYYQHTYGILPIVDCSDISTRFRMGHDPHMVQRPLNPVVIWQELLISEPQVNQSDGITDNDLIIRVIELIQQGCSQRKASQELGISQARISRLIAKSKE